MPTGTPVTKTITYTSTGSQPVTVNNVALGGADPGGANADEFKLGTGACVDGTDLAPAASCTVLVSFAPTSGGSAASLSVTTDLATGNTVALSGTATAPADIVAPSIPSGVKGTVIIQSAIDVTWTASTDNVAVAGYDIYRDANTTTPVGSVNGTTTTFHDRRSPSAATRRSRRRPAGRWSGGIRTARR